MFPSHDPTPVATAITHPASWDPHTILKFRDRYWSWGDDTNKNRIHYSVPGDYTDWTTSGTTGSIDVGADPNLPIVGVWPLYDSLIIAMRDFRWYLYRFTDDPQFGEIRYIGTKRIPDFAVQVAETGDSLIFLTENGGIVSITPNSIDDVSLDHIRVPTGTPLTTDHYFYRGLAAHDRNSVCLPFGVNGIPSNSAKEIFTGDMSLDFVNGVWVQSIYFGTNTQWTPTFVEAFEAGVSHFGFLATPDDVSGSTWATYVRPATLNRPSNDDDEFSDGTEEAAHTSDTSTNQFYGQLYLAAFHPEDEEGKPSAATIESIIIEFDYWNASGFATPGS